LAIVESSRTTHCWGMYLLVMLNSFCISAAVAVYLLRWFSVRNCS
jgi:hypothetical protein